MTLTIDEPGRLDFVARRGDTFRKPITFGGSGFDPSDLVGFTARMDIRDPETNELLISLTTANGRILIPGGDTTVTLLLTDDDTRDALWDDGEYDFELKDSAGSGDVATYLFGTFCLVDEITTTET